MSYTDNFWYSEESRTILVISMFSINTICVSITCYYSYRLFKLRKYNFIQKRHPNLLFCISILSILTLINSPIQCAAFLNIWLRYSKWAVSLNLLLTFYAWLHLEFLRTWIFRFDCKFQRMRRNAAWKKELLGEEYEMISNKFTSLIIKYKHILGNDRKISMIFIISYTIFVILMEIIVLISSAIYQILIILWLIIFVCGWSYTLKQFQSYDDGLGISKEGKNLKYISFIFTPIYATNILLWRFNIIPEEIYRICLCLLVTIAVFFAFLMMIRPIIDNYNDIIFGIKQIDNKNKKVMRTMIPQSSHEEQISRKNKLKSVSSLEMYNKYRLQDFLTDYQAFVLYSRHCVKVFCAENLIFLFKVMEYKLKFAHHLVYGIETDDEYSDIFGYRLLFPKKLFTLSEAKEQLINSNGIKSCHHSHFSSKDIDSSIQYLHTPSQRGISTPHTQTKSSKHPISLFSFDSVSQTQTLQKRDFIPTISNNNNNNNNHETVHNLSKSITLNDILSGRSNGRSSVPSQSELPPLNVICLKHSNISHSISGIKQSSIESVDEEEVGDDTEPIDSPKTLFNRKQHSIHINIGENEHKMDEMLISERMDELSMKIFCEYIEIGSIHEVNISSAVKKNLQKIFKPELFYKNKEIAKEHSIAAMCIADKFAIFDIAADQIEQMMRKDTFARFKRTKEFRDFVKTWSIKR